MLESKLKTEGAVRSKDLRTLDLLNTALVVIDMQNDFLDPKGKLYLGKSSPLKLTQVISNVETIIKHFIAKELPIYMLTDNHFVDSLEFETLPSHCVLGTWGRKLYPAIADLIEPYVMMGRGTIIPKTGFNGSQYLMDEMAYTVIDKLYIVGVTSDICVFFTTMGLAEYFEGKNLHIIEDATMAFNDVWNETAKDMMKSLRGIDIIGGNYE
jgi:nicotinamidase-related amidase